MGRRTFLYHSFPRRGRHEPAEEKRRGLVILRSILEGGILCVPETVNVDAEFEATNPIAGMQIPIDQNRFCLTLLDPCELPRHADHFGRFAVAFSTNQAREIGAIPVIYVPLVAHGERPSGVDLIGLTLVRRLIEIQYVLTDLATIASANGCGDLIVLKNLSRGERRVLERLTKRLLGEIDPMQHLAGAMRAVLKLFYPVERGGSNVSRDDQLAYYYQREWRVLDGVTVFDNQLDTPLTDFEKERLMELDAAFFGKWTVFGDTAAPRIDWCRVIRHVGGRPVRDLIDHIRAPAEYLSDAKALAFECHFVGDVLALEEP